METIFTNIIPHNELNSLVTLASSCTYNISFGISDVLEGGEPRFKIYNNRHPCHASYGIEVSLIRPVFKKEDRIFINNRLLGEIDTICRGPSALAKYTVFQMLCTMWNFLNGFLHLPEDADDDYSLFDAYANGEFDTQENLSNTRYLPSNAIQPDYTQIDVNNSVNVL